MRILITGGAGYIGTHTCVELLNNGYDVVVVDNLYNSSRIAVERVKKLTGKDFPFYDINVCDKEALSKVFADNIIDAVIHFAGYKAVGESVDKPLKYYENNLNSTITLCNVMLEYGVNKIIFSSSATVYRGDNKMPLNEDCVLGCTNPYGWTKYIGERILTDVAAANKGFSAVLLRYFNPVGAHESGMLGEDPRDIPNNLMPYICQTAIGKLKQVNVFGNDYDTKDGTGVRDYIHVVDLAKGHVAALKYLNSHSGVEAVNLGTGVGYSVLEMIQAFSKACGKQVPYVIVGRRAGDLGVVYADPSKAHRILGWEAEKTLDQMCADAWNWQKKNPNGYES